MKQLYGVYRVLAWVVGVLLVVCTLTSIAKYGAPDGTSVQQLGADLAFLWAFHGFVYMAYFVVAFLLGVQARWSLVFTVLMLAAGLVPLLMFWVERRVADRMRTDHPDVVGATAG